MPLRPLVLCLLLAGCAHPRAQQGDQRPGTPPVRTTPDSRPDVAVTPSPAPTPPVQRVDFVRDVRPILESKCQPCHFAGGRMYDRLPFDRPETVHQLGTKLFSRIKSENEQAVIRQFLSQGP